MLKVGTVAIKCYWQKTPRTAVNGENHMHSITNAINSSNTNPELNGLNIQPIAVLVTQVTYDISSLFGNSSDSVLWILYF